MKYFWFITGITGIFFIVNTRKETVPEVESLVKSVIPKITNVTDLKFDVFACCRGTAVEQQS